MLTVYITLDSQLRYRAWLLDNRGKWRQCRTWFADEAERLLGPLGMVLVVRE